MSEAAGITISVLTPGGTISISFYIKTTPVLPTEFLLNNAWRPHSWQSVFFFHFPGLWDNGLIFCDLWGKRYTLSCGNMCVDTQVLNPQAKSQLPHLLINVGRQGKAVWGWSVERAWITVLFFWKTAEHTPPESSDGKSDCFLCDLRGPGRGSACSQTGMSTRGHQEWKREARGFAWMVLGTEHMLCAHFWGKWSETEGHSMWMWLLIVRIKVQFWHF